MENGENRPEVPVEEEDPENVTSDESLSQDENDEFQENSTSVAVTENHRKPYTCFYCEFSVKKLKYLKSHIQTFHEMEEVRQMEEPPVVKAEPEEESPPAPGSAESETQPVPDAQPTATPALQPTPGTAQQTRKFDMDLCPYCDFSDKVEKKLRHHILSKHSKELDKIIIYSNESDKPRSLLKQTMNKEKNHLLNSFTNGPLPKRIKQETSDKNQNDIVPFTIQPDIEIVSLNNSRQVEGEDFRCSHCTYSTSEAWELMLHISAKHPEFTQGASEGEASSAPLEGGKVYSCEHCEYTTHRAQLLSRHLMSKHSERKPHRCNECDYATKRAEHLHRHVLSKHSGERPFPCQFCDYRAARDDHLRNHVLSKHSGEQLLRCELCGYSALSTEHLEAHMLAKHPPPKVEEPPEAESKEGKDAVQYDCDMCPYSTTRSDHLSRHQMAVHAGERPHCCPECDYRATRLSHLTRHIQSKHSGVKPFLCPQCDYRAGRMEHLHRHMMARHSSDQTLTGALAPCYACDFVGESKAALDAHVLTTHMEGAAIYGHFCDIPIKTELLDCDQPNEPQTQTKGDPVS